MRLRPLFLRPLLLPAALVGTYLALSLLTLFSWHNAGFFVTGDEPHYLVMTRGLVVDHTLEQTVPYREAFAQSLFLGSGITDPPSPANTHAYLGPHGLFNIHSFGLPLLLAIPYAVHGVTAVKIALVIVGAFGVVMFYKISGVFTPVRWVRALSVASVAIALPLLPAANQIFPDIPAGVLALVGLYALLTAARRRPLWQQVLIGIAVGYLPLLQIKYAAPALVLSVALAIAFARRDGRLRSVLAVTVPFVVLLALLVAFNLYAFGSPAGPYEQGAFALGAGSVMVFAGLALDQSQGLLFQNLIAFAGLVGVGLLFAWRRGFAVTWMLVLLALVIPNALLANEYGGYSFIGRFEYSAALVFSVATLLALSRLAAAAKPAFIVVCAVSLAAQAVFYALYTFAPDFLQNAGRTMYNQGSGPWLLNDSLFYFPLQNWLPALYDSSWAFGFLPNYAWAMAGAALLAAGFVIGFGRGALQPRRWMPVAAGLVALIVAAGFVSAPPAQPRTYQADELQVAQGVTAGEGADRAVAASAAAGDSPGIVTYGPATLLRAGAYTVALTYSSSSDTSAVVGSWRPVLGTHDPAWQRELHGTNGQWVTVSEPVDLSNWVPASLQVQTLWYGTGSMGIRSLTYALQNATR